MCNTWLFGIVASIVALQFNGCRLIGKEAPPQKSISEGVSWEGKGPISYSLDSTGVSGDAIDTSLYSYVKRNHHLTFFSSDSIYLVLHEFESEYLAFTAFAGKANPLEVGELCYRNRNILVFLHGRFVGEIQYASSGLIPTHFLKANLHFEGEEVFSLPPEFLSFPVQGRIPKSERVVWKYFLGKNWAFPVFSIRYRCHDDTATAFRTFPQRDSSRSWIRQWAGRSDTLDWGREIHFQGQNEMHEPVVFWTFPKGELGIAGCYDPLLALAYAQKMKKMTVLLTKP